MALFDSLTPNSSLTWTLTGPEGAVVDARRFDQSDSSGFSGNPVLDLAPGDYVLTVDGAGDTTAFYNFLLTDLANATPLPTGPQVPAGPTSAHAPAPHPPPAK